MPWLRDPLTHFVVLGALVFMAHRLLVPAEEPGQDSRVLVLDEPFVEALVRERAARVGRSPESIDRDAARADWIREEALVREARALALDSGDAIIRRRLVQKLELLVRAGVEVDEPTDLELTAYLEAHADQHQDPPRVSFEHRYFSPQRRAERAQADATTALAGLAEVAGLADVAPLADGAALADAGDAFPLGAVIERRELSAIEDTFGPAFASALASAPEGRWSGPISSRYGVHLVRVIERSEGRALTLEEVRSVIRGAVIEEREESAAEAALDAIVQSYPVDESP